MSTTSTIDRGKQIADGNLPGFTNHGNKICAKICNPSKQCDDYLSPRHRRYQETPHTIGRVFIVSNLLLANFQTETSMVSRTMKEAKVCSKSFNNVDDNLSKAANVPRGSTNAILVPLRKRSECTRGFHKRSWFLDGNLYGFTKQNCGQRTGSVFPISVQKFYPCDSSVNDCAFQSKPERRATQTSTASLTQFDLIPNTVALAASNAAAFFKRSSFGNTL